MRRAAGAILSEYVLSQFSADFSASLAAAAFADSAAGSQIATADHVVVRKAEHKLYLYSGSQLLGLVQGRIGAGAGRPEGA